MRLLLFSIALFIGVLVNAQTTDNLKDFINKNSYAIKSVHKNMIAQKLNNYSDTFKDILIQQESAVKAFKSDRNTSSAFAYNVRRSCLEFLNQHYKNSINYFEVTSEEQQTLGAQKKSSDKLLSESELKTIQSLDVFNFQSLSNLTLTIQ